MIDARYVLTMARYNAWQNRQIIEIVKTMDKEALTLDRGVFFGSISRTLNHLLWADTLWMSRLCSDVPAPEPGGDTTDITRTIGDWQAQRFMLDGRIRIWAQTLSNLDLQGELTWRSQIYDKDFHTPVWQCVTHMFNHQTHHRGQVHAMLTQAGLEAPVTDLLFMPEES